MRTVAAGHRLIAEGWEMFEVVEAAGTGDLPQLLRSLRGMTMLTPPPPPPTPPQAGLFNKNQLQEFPWKLQGCQECHQWRKRGRHQSQLLLLLEGGKKMGLSTVFNCKGVKNGCNAHIRQAHTGKVLLCGLCGFSTYNLDSLSRHEKEHN